MPHTYNTSQWLPHPVPRVFAFFANPANLPRLMPAWQSARIDSIALVPAPSPDSAAPSTPAAGAGTRMTLSFRPIPFSPVRLAWDAEIAEFAWNDHFCDIQLRRGPFAFWRHCHHVREQSRNGTPGTLLVDELEYELPFAPLSELPHPRIIRPQIERVFSYRHKRAAELLGEAG
jgi:ligand-binding SRPBCC domain-containing protein